ncbi:MAG: FkbM family methyltransferase [Planctomycetaceae bacterium]
MSTDFRQLLRVCGLRLLRATARDFHIQHHWVPGQQLKLNSYKHKGYWWHGKTREANALTSIATFLRPGHTVLDIGAHIGYFTTYFARLVGTTGRVLAIEPSDDNLRYTRFNIDSLSQVQLETRGISNHIGEATFFVESLTGQNNSLVEDYEVFEANAAKAGVAVEKRKVTICVTTVDSICSDYGLSPHFIKMDIEGAEYEALEGMINTLRKARPVVLIEISRRHHDCWALLRSLGYKPLDESLEPVSEREFAVDKPWPSPVNYFFVPE